MNTVFDYKNRTNILNDFGVPMTISELAHIKHYVEPYDVTLESIPPSDDVVMLTHRCNGVYTNYEVINFLSNPVNHEFVEFMIGLRSDDLGMRYTCHDEDHTFCCDESGHIYLINGKPMTIHQCSTFAYEMAMGSSMCLIPNSNLKMFVESARDKAIRKGFDIGKVVFPKCVADPSGHLRDRFASLGFDQKTLRKIYGFDE